MTYRPPVDEKTKAARAMPPERLTAIAKRFGVTTTTLRMWTDPEYARRRMDAINEARRQGARPQPWDYSKP